MISIHALREEGDRVRARFARACVYFYPRPPRGGRRQTSANKLYSTKFLSTPSARRATLILHGADVVQAISIHALREEGDSARLHRGLLLYISIHALREEGDSCQRCLRRRGCNFYPRPPRGGRRRRCRRSPIGQYFYPRPPRGGRQQKQRQNLYFQTNYTTFCTNLEEL